MCAVCGYTADDFWASFAVDQNGPLSPAAVRSRRARSLCEWVQRATRAVVAERDQRAEASSSFAQVTVEIGARTEQAAFGLFSGALIKAGNQGYTVSSPTGAMRFCSSLHTVVSHIKKQHPHLCHVLDCRWPSDYRQVDWATWGAAWTWNAVMNDNPHPLPERVELEDGRWLCFEPLDNDKVRVSLENLEIAA